MVLVGCPTPLADWERGSLGRSEIGRGRCRGGFSFCVVVFGHAAALGHALQRRGLEGINGDLSGTDTAVSGKVCTERRGGVQGDLNGKLACGVCFARSECFARGERLLPRGRMRGIRLESFARLGSLRPLGVLRTRGERE